MGLIGLQVELGLLTDKGFISFYANAFALKMNPFPQQGIIFSDNRLFRLIFLFTIAGWKLVHIHLHTLKFTLIQYHLRSQ